MDKENYHLKFWGTRGSLPVNSPAHAKYGGNSSCVEVCFGDAASATSATGAASPASAVLIDGGSGMRMLGEKLAKQGVKDIHILISHFHNDHICGIPFFAPLFEADVTVTFHTIAKSTAQNFETALNMYMADPIYPVGTDIFDAQIIYKSHAEGAVIKLPHNMTATSHPIPHPGGCHAYRITDGQRHVVYATDTEHDPQAMNTALVDFIKNADVLIYDCTYDDADFDRFIGFGHSTWQEGIRLCQAAQVRRLAIFHHAPERNDAALDAIAEKARRLFDGAVVTGDFQTMRIDE